VQPGADISLSWRCPCRSLPPMKKGVPTAPAPSQLIVSQPQPTDQEKKLLLPLPGEPQHLGASSGSFQVDFPEPGQASGWRQLLAWAFGLVTLFALVLVVLHFGTIEEFTRLARAARPEWLFLVCVAQAATYMSASLVWRQALRRAGHPRSLSTLIPLGIAKLFTDQVVQAAVSAVRSWSSEA